MSVNVSKLVRVQAKDAVGTWNTISDGSQGFTLTRHRDKAGVINLSLWDVNGVGFDPSKFPGNNQHLRKGQACRVQSSIDGTTWVVEYTGVIRAVDVDPNINALKGTLRKITVKATNVIADMIMHSQGTGAGVTDDMRYTLGSAGYTNYNVNGVSTALASPASTTYPSDTNHVWEQTMTTRDSQGLYVHADKNDVIQVADAAHKSTSTVATFTTADYSDVALNYTLEHVLNDVTGHLVVKGANGKTHVRFSDRKTDSASITKYGTFKAKYKFHGLSDAQVTTRLNAIIAANSDPAIVPTGCTVPINSTSDITNFVQGIDINDKVSITDPDGTTYSVRVVSINHTVTPDTWNVTFGFINPALIARPRKSGGTGVANVTDLQVENTHVYDGELTTQKVAYPVIGAISSTAPSTPKDKDVWIDTASGNIIKVYNIGTGLWTSLQDTAINTAQSTANGKNKVTYSTVDPGATANTAGDLWFTYAGSVVSKQWQGNGGTSWTQVTVADTVIANIDAGKITTGYLNAARIQAGTITADKLLIGGGLNQAANPGFETGVIAPHYISGGTGAITTTGIRTGQKALQLTLTSTSAGFTINGYQYSGTTGVMPVVQGDAVHCEVWVQRVSGTLANASINIYALNAAGTLIGGGATGANTSLTTSYQKVVVDYVVAAGVSYVAAEVNLTGGVAGAVALVDDMLWGIKTTGALIVNGAIDGQTITGAVINTKTGLGTTGVAGMSIQDDTSAGVIKFYTGVASETPGMINPGLVSAVLPTISIASGTTPTYSQTAKIDLTSNSTGTGSKVIVTAALMTFTGTASTDSFQISAGNLWLTNGGIHWGGATSNTKAITFGQSATTANASGQVAVTHGLGQTPTAINVTEISQNRQIRVIARTSTTFTVEGRVGATDAILTTGQVCSFDWACFA